MTPTEDPVLYELRDSGVAVLTLNRPERMNGWGGGLATSVLPLLDRAEADPAVRAIVVTGSGRAFCAGADMGDLTSIGDASTDGDTDVTKLVGERHPHFVTTLRKPVIAADQRRMRRHRADPGADVRRRGSPPRAPSSPRRSRVAV